MRIFVLNSVGAFLLLLGKLVITALTCTAAVFWLRVSDALLSISSYSYHSLLLAFSLTYVFNQPSHSS